MKKASEPKAHAKLSASGSDRWLNCPGSVALSENAPAQEESEYAKEGTDAHSCLEAILKNHGKKPYSAAQMLRSKFPDSMVEHAIAAYKEIAARIPEGATLLCETKVDLTFVGPDMFGTVDAAIVDEFGELHVIDYKYGAGVAVDPDENTQLIYYALGIAHKYAFNFSKVVLTIIQPRAEHKNGPIRQWSLEIDELIKWTDRFKNGVKRTQEPVAELKTGDWCRWCPAKTICPKLSDEAFAQAQIDFEPETDSNIFLPVANMVRPEKIANVLDAAKKIETWIEAIKEHALHLAKSGVRIPGYKVVQKRSTRKWVNAESVSEEAEMLWGTEAFTKPELLSPAQLEKAVEVDPDWIEENTTKESSGVTLAPESDSRPEYNAIDADYSELTEGKGDDMAKKKVVKKKTKTVKKIAKPTKNKKR